MALDWVVEKFSVYDKHAVVYFMDDDNAYDHRYFVREFLNLVNFFRLFDKYIRKVKNIGVWAVGEIWIPFYFLYKEPFTNRGVYHLFQGI